MSPFCFKLYQGTNLENDGDECGERQLLVLIIDYCNGFYSIDCFVYVCN